MSNELTASIELINQKLKFKGIAKENPDIIIDYIPPLGDGEGYMSLELLLVSLSSCSGSAIITLLRRMKKDIEGLKVNAKGLRMETPPYAFSEISLEFIITSKYAGDDDIKRAIKLSEDSYCPVWAMLKNSVKIETEYKIIN